MKRAFTLVELIVVIGIIVILMGILIPALSGSSESAKAAKCLANMHSLAMGVQARAMESSRYPFAGSIAKYKSTRHSAGTTAVHGWIGWSTDDASGSYISPYSTEKDARFYSLTNGAIWRAVGRNRDVYVCPTHRDQARKHLGGKDKYGPCWSYVMNAWFGWASQNTPFSSNHNGHYYENVALKSKILLFAELPFIDCGDGAQQARYDSGASKENDPVLQYDKCSGGGSEAIGFNHKQGKREVFAHVCFADGHTEKYRFPRGGNAANLKELTRWLCYPFNKNGSGDTKYFDIMQNSSGGYEAVDN